jgi:hypothetical protein
VPPPTAKKMIIHIFYNPFGASYDRYVGTAISGLALLVQKLLLA